jgi:glycosyltransferase involved in cell wall biosynthesis
LEKNITVVMPAYNEEEGIAETVCSFLSQPQVAEVVVVDNNSSDRTAERGVAAGARLVPEQRQGYGFACRRALQESRTEWTLLVESDGTFRPEDMQKFAVYASEFDVVFGTRTSRACIWEGANMGNFLRYGNVAVAKYLEYLHNGPCLTDVGCTYKLLRSDVIADISRLWKVGNSAFSPELMILCIRRGWRCIEIPVHYGSRTGISKITGSFWKAFRLGWRMIFLITAYRFRNIPHTALSAKPNFSNIKTPLE